MLLSSSDSKCSASSLLLLLLLLLLRIARALGYMVFNLKRYFFTAPTHPDPTMSTLLSGSDSRCSASSLLMACSAPSIGSCIAQQCGDKLITSQLSRLTAVMSESLAVLGAGYQQ
jgi:hypothetical protein